MSAGIMNGIITGAMIAQDTDLESRLTEAPRLRGGNSGCITEDGKIIGRCGREAVMRYFGVNKTFSYNKLLMFKAGEVAEDILVEWLSHSWEGKIIKEVAASWTTDNGIDVTCRGDLGLLTEDDTLVHGLEVKNTSSMWTAKKVAPWGPYMNDRPELKIDAACQAAHYSMANGFVPWSVVYVSSNNWHVPYSQKLRKYDGWPEYFEKDDKNTNKNIAPFIAVFNLDWEDGRAYFTEEQTGSRIKTPITADGIRDYYGLLAECVQQQRLPERSATVDIYGRKQSGWSLYDPAYNDFSELHDKYDAGKLTFDEFLQEAKVIARTGVS